MKNGCLQISARRVIENQNYLDLLEVKDFDKMTDVVNTKLHSLCDSFPKIEYFSVKRVDFCLNYNLDSAAKVAAYINTLRRCNMPKGMKRTGMYDPIAKRRKPFPHAFSFGTDGHVEVAVYDKQHEMRGEKPGVYVNGEDRQFASKGYNLYNSVAGNGSFAADASDKAGVSVSGLGLTWNAAGYYIWNGSVAGFTKAKLSDIENAVKTGCNKAAGVFTNLGLDFYNWLQSLESGRNPLAYDQAGNARDAAAMWPGAYEKH